MPFPLPNLSPETVVSAALASAVPLLLAGVGECVVERAGVVNIGVEGLMLVAALAAVMASHAAASAAVGVLAAVAAAMLLAAGFGAITIYRNANQVVAGTAVNLLALGLTGAINGTVTRRLALENVSRLAGVKLPSLSVPLLSRLPVVGPTLFAGNALVYLAFLSVPAAWWFLQYSRPGLQFRAVGEYPEAAEAAGTDVRRTRLLAVLAGASLTGLAGAFLSIGHVVTFVENMTAGRGFIALALVIFARWNPWGVLAGALIFSLATGLATSLGSSGRGSPAEVFLLALPYLATLIALLPRARHALAPAALGLPYGKY